MNQSGNLYLADSILVIHFAFVVFVVGGLALILAGMVRGWAWIRNFPFRICHLLAIGFVVAQAWLGEICPLTRWENALRESAGQAGYQGTFVQHWLQKILFYEFPFWVFTVVYTIFGVLVLLTWILKPPVRRAQAGNP